MFCNGVDKNDTILFLSKGGRKIGSASKQPTCLLCAQGNHQGARGVVVLAVHTALAPGSASLVSCDEVCREVDVGDEPRGVKNQVGPFKGGEGVPRAVVKPHGVGVGLG